MKTGCNRLRLALAALAAAVACAGVAGAAEQNRKTKTYRWVDKDGVVHFGDHIPSEYASADRQILNEYGVPVGGQDIALTAEERAAQKEAAKRAEEERQKALLAARRDQILLDTYLSVEEIEALRDRRLELLDTQIKVTENYLAGLREILGKLQAEAAGFKPYSDDPQAPSIDERLAGELANTMDSIMLYEKNLADTRKRKHEVVDRFSADIDRFRTLKTAVAEEQ
jgi:hypothetical protein